MLRFNDTADGYRTYDAFENKQVDIGKNNYDFFYFYSKNKLDAKHFLDYMSNEAHNNGGIRM